MLGGIPIRLRGSVAALMLAAAPAAAQPYQFPHYEVSFAGGASDPAGHFMGPTEVRDLVAFGGKLYAGVGYWMDQPGPEGKRTAQVLVKDGVSSPWRQDVDFGDFCPSTAPKCALATGALVPLHFTRDADGKPADVWVLAASIWPVFGTNPQPVKVYARNNADGAWHETVIGEAESGQARAFATHVDAKTGESLAFVHGGSIGIFKGWLSPKRGAGQNPIIWETGAENAEFVSASLPETHCTNTDQRVMGFAEAEGALFASKCYDIIRRNDGPRGRCKADEVSGDGGACGPRWVRFWSSPYQTASNDGLRGITTVSSNGQNWLLVGYEGPQAYIQRVDPKTAAAVTELDVTSVLENAWQTDVGYIITSYSSPMPLWYGADGVGRRLIGLHAGINQTTPAPGHSFMLNGNTGGQAEGDGWYFLRDGPWAYRLFKLPAIMGTRMQSVRAAAVSPFKEDCDANGRNCAIYFGGFDAISSPTATPCFAAPCGVLPAVPTHLTGWIVKGHD